MSGALNIFPIPFLSSSNDSLFPFRYRRGVTLFEPGVERINGFFERLNSTTAKMTQFKFAAPEVHIAAICWEPRHLLNIALTHAHNAKVARCAEGWRGSSCQGILIRAAQ